MACYRLRIRHALLYSEHTRTGQQQSLKTKDNYQSRTLVTPMNEAQRQPMLNLQIARAFLRAADPAYASRTRQAQ